MEFGFPVRACAVAVDKFEIENKDAVRSIDVT